MNQNSTNSFAKVTNKISSIFRDKFSDDIHSKELYNGTIQSLVLRIVGTLIGYLFLIIVAKYFGSGITGIFVLSILILNALTILATLGNENAILVITSKYFNSDDTKYVSNTYKKLLLITTAVSIFLSILIFYSSDLIAVKLFNKPALILPLRYLSFAVLPLSLIKINSQLLRALKKVKLFVYFNNVSVYLTALGILSIWLIFDKIDTTIYISILIASYLTLFVSLIPTVKEIKKLNRTASSIKFNIYNILNISLPLFGTNILTYLKIWISVFVVGIFLTKSMVGVYGVATRMIAVFSIIIFSVSAISMPKIGNMYEVMQKDTLKKFVPDSARMTSYLGVPLILISILFAKPILEVLGGKFNIGFVSYLILCSGQLIEVIFSPSNFTLQMVGRQKIYFYVLTFSTILQIILCVSLVPVWGINGAAFAYLVGVLVNTIILSSYIKIKLGLNAYYVPKIFSSF